MGAQLAVILPVFFVIAFGYVVTWRGMFPAEGNDILMKFTQGFAIPCLLFYGIVHLDLRQSFDPHLMISFYTGAFSGFGLGLLGARFLFGRSWEDAVAIGFIGLFSNSLLLGLAITERAYGPDALTANYAILSIHAPIGYLIGITAMEIVKNRHNIRQLPYKVSRAMFHNAVVIGVGLGLIVNLSGLPIPQTLDDALALISRAALPAALFGLGGVLVRYRPEGDMKVILYIVAVSLVAHPLITYSLGLGFGLSTDSLRSAVVTGSMAPGINAYVFAIMYGHANRMAASAVVIATGASIATVTIWLQVLP
jgi:predicted permease